MSDGDARADDEVRLRLDLPPVPVLRNDLLDRWHEAHDVEHDAARRLAPAVAAAVGLWHGDRCLEGLAGVTPSVSGTVDPPLFPAPRAFLSATDVERLAATRAALDHVAARHRIGALGIDRTPVQPETPFVLHALAEGRTTGPYETNPGLLRVHAWRWAFAGSPYDPPPPAVVRHLTTRLVADAATLPDHPLAVAGWAAFCWLTIHPFADGNGRTARLLYLLLASQALAHLDLGVLELVGQRRRAYLDAIHAGQWTTPHWDPDVLDAGPLTTTLAAWSTEAAVRQAVRLRAAGAVADAIAGRHPGLDEEGLGTAVRAWLSRLLDPGDLMEPTLGGDPPSSPVRGLEVLVDAGVLERLPLPPSRRRAGRAVVGYRLRPATTEAADAVASAAVTGAEGHATT
ncbi:MAG: Fic family protein [Acidimicrobiales bacterium]